MFQLSKTAQFPPDYVLFQAPGRASRRGNRRSTKTFINFMLAGAIKGSCCWPGVTIPLKLCLQIITLPFGEQDEAQFP